MLKFENNAVYVLDNVTDSVIYSSDLENIVKAFAGMNELSAKSNKYFERYEQYDDEVALKWSTEYHDKLNAQIDLFNTLFGTDIRSYMIFTLED